MAYQIVLLTDITGQIYHNKALGAYSLASTLRNIGYTVLVVDQYSRLTEHPSDLLKILKKSIGAETLFVGFSGSYFTVELPETKSVNSWRAFNHGTPTAMVNPRTSEVVIRCIKQLNPSTKIVYGGTQANNINFPGIDYIVKGYG